MKGLIFSYNNIISICAYLVVRTVSNGMTDRSCSVANRALVLVQDGASDTAIVILSQ